MTILVGLYCDDGVVIAADSVATSAHGRTPTISGLATSKIEIVKDQVIIATTGAVGLGQRFRFLVGKAYEDKKFQENAHNVSTHLSRVAMMDFQNTGVPKHPAMGFGFGALVAAPVQGAHHLIEYDAVDFQPEQKSASLLFVSMGSGQPIADPFLGFLKRVFWPSRRPTLREGIFGAIWTLSHTISLAPGGIGGEPHVAVLEKGEKGRWNSRILADEEIAEHKDHCRAIEKGIGGYFTDAAKHAESGGQTPEVPKPPANA